MDEDTEITIDQYIAYIENDLKKFKADWIKGTESQGKDIYPEKMNLGDWNEQFGFA